MEKKLEVKNLRISFRTDAGKVQAVRGINFDLYKGETLAIVGESGSGKSVTNKAIIGISAPNAIVESGKIIYDGRDLIQIPEEEFHKLRGDKISMIFQDPLSALDPINKIGPQLTEAMILKNKVNREESRKDFNTYLANVLHYMNHGMGFKSKDEEAKPNIKDCHDFNEFEVLHVKLEGAYTDANQNAITGKEDTEDLLFRIEKNAVTDFSYTFKTILRQATHSVNKYVCSEEILTHVEALKAIKLVRNGKDYDYSPLVPELKELVKCFEEGINKEAPNFFALAYFQTFGTEELPNLEVKELNEYLRKYLDENFMLSFIDKVKVAIDYSFNRSKKKMAIAVEALKKAKVEVFSKIDVNDSKSEYASCAKELYKLVKDSIDKLALVKDSLAYTFESSLRKSLDIFFGATKNNKQENKRFEKETKQIEKIIAKGKEPEYKVIPPKVIDLDMAKANIIEIIDDITTHFEDLIKNSTINLDTKAVEVIDYLKAKAQAVAYVVTKGTAKLRAIKLMEEVGIPEPRKRFNQFPFEFSGGMRQRIVIAIALSANPDILICDEPTTALDVTIQSQILELINKIKKERNLSVIFITHNLGVVANMADRVAVMYAGKIVEIGTVDDIFYNPRHPYTWALLSSMPDLDTNEKLESIVGTPPNMIYPPKGDAFAARNKYALKIDFEEEPPMFKISDTHYAATWLLHEDAPKIDIPKQLRDRIERMKKKSSNEKSTKEGE